VTAIHGESDDYAYATNTQEFPLDGTDGSPGTITSYADALLEWQRDYEAGAKAITGQTIAIPLLISQFSGWNDIAHSAALSTLARLPEGESQDSGPPAELEDGPHFTYVESPGAQTAVQILFRSLPESDPDFVAMQALGRVLDDGMSTRLHYTLCDQLGLAYYVSSSIEPFHDAALFEVDGAAAHAKVGELLTRMLGLLARFREEPVTPAELAKAKRRYRYDLASAFDDADAMAGWFGGTELFYPPPSYESKVARMEAVTAEDIQRAAGRVFQRERLVVAASGALGERQKRDVQKVVKSWR
jgi:predicted Zn-dependent peptidase